MSHAGLAPAAADPTPPPLSLPRSASASIHQLSGDFRLANVVIFLPCYNH